MSPFGMPHRCPRLGVLAVALLGVLLVALPALAAESITAAEAASRIGKTATVCGIVASGNYAEKSKGSPTFLNLDKPYPDHIFTVLIRSEDRSKFGTPERSLKGKRVCVTGKIQDYQGKPELILRDPNQLTTQ